MEMTICHERLPQVSEFREYLLSPEKSAVYDAREPEVIKRHTWVVRSTNSCRAVRSFQGFGTQQDKKTFEASLRA
jgi:hypothetical protein